MAGTELAHLTNRYAADKVRRGDWQRASMKMPRSALSSFVASYGNRPVRSLGESAVNRWLEQIAHLAPATRRNMLGVVRGFCDWLVKHRIIRRNPCADIPKIRQPRRVVHTVPRAAVEALYDVCRTERDRCWVDLMYVTGLRCIDVSRLNVEDWDRRQRILIVTGKGMHERVVPVAGQLQQSLTAWVALCSRTTGPMFPSWDGRIKSATISGRMSYLMRDAGIKDHPFDGVSAHALRRTAATETLEASGNLRAVQNLLGHADLSSMRHYIARASIAEIAQAVEARFGDG